MRIPNVLTVAGNDPSGGAGIAADLKTFGALGVYGMAVLTALTVQNTRGVIAIHPVPALVVAAQLEGLIDDVRIDAVKIGMLPDADVVSAVGRLLGRSELGPIILDPVLLSSTGSSLAGADVVEAMKAELFPITDVLTPNLHEASVILGRPPATTLAQMLEQAAQLRTLGPRYVYLKGGHLPGAASPDVLATPDGITVLPALRIDVVNDHGTGCTLSSAIAALVTHRGVASAAVFAKRYVLQALSGAHCLSVGSGRGPLHHFHGASLAPVGSEPARIDTLIL